MNYIYWSCLPCAKTSLHSTLTIGYVYQTYKNINLQSIIYISLWFCQCLSVTTVISTYPGVIHLGRPRWSIFHLVFIRWILMIPVHILTIIKSIFSLYIILVYGITYHFKIVSMSQSFKSIPFPLINNHFWSIRQFHISKIIESAQEIQTSFLSLWTLLNKVLT